MPLQKLPDLDQHLTNKVMAKIQGRTYFAGIVGEKPSHYSKSPVLWNAAFEEIGLDAIYIPMDVEDSQLDSLLKQLRQSPMLLGFNVTVPHKTKIIRFLDELTKEAEQIGAVNTVVRTHEGRFIGHNTDSVGAINGLTKVLPGQSDPFIKSLSGLTVLLLGAGGSARALAFSIAKALGKGGKLFVCNRGRDKAKILSQEVNGIYGNTEEFNQTRLIHIEKEREVQEADLIINATVVGQSDVQVLVPSGGKRISLQDYSPLWPVKVNNEDDLNENLKMSNYILGFFAKAKLFDLIYSPEETTFLRQGKLTGHPTLNGKNMMLWQAVDSFSKIVENIPKVHKVSKQKLLKIMAQAWERS